MRKRSLDTVYKLARRNKDVVFVGSDLGYKLLDDFKKELPKQFFMEGVSEQHIVGMSAGLAMSGKIVYFNTIATFITRRAFEQNVIDLGLHKLRVRLLGSGGGLVYAPLGPTHLAIEDIAIMRAIPHMTVVAPCDADEMERVIVASESHPNPMYIRFAKGGDPIVSKEDFGFEIGKAILYQNPGEVLFVTTGIMLNRAIEASQHLKESGISSGILHFHTIKPFDKAALIEMVGKVSLIVTLEEHAVSGGIGSAAAEILAETSGKNRPLLLRLGLPDEFPDQYGSQNSMLEHYGLFPAAIASSVKKSLVGISRTQQEPDIALFKEAV